MTDALIDNNVTIDEQIKIIKRARNLIWEPANWCTGSWKCPVVRVGPDGDTVPAINKNGTQEYQYCIEGAVNQATYDVLGEERAMALGAVTFNQEKGELEFAGAEEALGYDPSSLLGLDDLASDTYGFECALEYNDHEYDANAEGDQVEADPKDTHQGVIDLLTTRLSQLTGRKEAA